MDTIVNQLKRHGRKEQLVLINHSAPDEKDTLPVTHVCILNYCAPRTNLIWAFCSVGVNRCLHCWWHQNGLICPGFPLSLILSWFWCLGWVTINYPRDRYWLLKSIYCPAFKWWMRRIEPPERVYIPNTPPPPYVPACGSRAGGTNCPLFFMPYDFRNIFKLASTKTQT